MNHLRWMGHSTTIQEIQRSLHEDTTSCEVTLAARGKSVKAHRFILCACSDLLRTLLADVPLGQEATIMLPDIKGNLLQTVFDFVYLGETSLAAAQLSEFLEAINTLGIKSAISFECSPAHASQLGADGALQMGDKPIEDMQLSTEILEHDQGLDKLEEQHIITEHPTSTRELEFLDVYNEPQHKITYSIEHVPGSVAGNEFILTENSGTYTLTQNAKLESMSEEQEKLDEEVDGDQDADVEADDNHIIEEYSNSADPIIEEMAEPNDHIESANIITTPPKCIKLKTFSNAIHNSQAVVCTKFENSDPISTKLEPDVHSESIDLAVEAVLNDGMSLQKAAKKYSISKTVLWRRVRKNPNYMKTTRENPVLTMAYERLKTGESLKNISKQLDIPMSTLHRHKVRLVSEGRLPEYITCKRRDPNSKETLKLKLAKAVHSCVHEGMSQNHAANKYDIPKSTLWRHLQKRVQEAEMAQEEIGVEDMESEEMGGTIKEEVILS